jgi:hypothetical protein
MALKVYRKNYFVILDNGSDKDFLQGLNSTFEIDTANGIVSFAERGTQLKNDSCIFSDVQDESGTPIGTLQQVEDYLSNTLGFNSALGGSSAIVFVDDVTDFPAAVGGVITLKDNVTYFVLNNIDLNGSRIVCGDNTTILGASSENCSITSTGLSISEYLISTDYTFPLRHITIKDVPKAIGINILGAGSNIALDWTGVNFSGCVVNVTCGDIDNFIFSKGAVLGSGKIEILGNAGTVSFDNSLFTGDGQAYNVIEVGSGANISRRFRVVYSSLVAFGSTVAIYVDAAATIPTESYILDTVNFSGGSTYLNGVDDTSNKSLFVNCVGIKNTAVNGQLYMQNNATSTTISLTNTFYKIAGTTSASLDNSKFLHSDNRLTCDAVIQRKYLIQCTLSFNSGNNNVCEFGFYDSQLGTIRTPSKTKGTANSAGRAENLTLACVVNMSQNDFLEVHCANTTGANDITVTDMNFTITEIK